MVDPYYGMPFVHGITIVLEAGALDAADDAEAFIREHTGCAARRWRAGDRILITTVEGKP